MATRAERGRGEPVRTLSGRPRISRLGVWDPDAALSQAEVIERLGMEGNPFATAVFEAAAVDRRHLSISGEALDRSFQGRATHGQERMVEYAVSTIDELKIDPAEIGTIVVASLYSVGVPTLAQRLAGHYAMDPAVDTYQLVGLGCASAVPLVRLMAQVLDPRSGRKGLIVAVERASDTLTRSSDSDYRVKAVGSAIFGDGCAAAVVEYGRDAPGPVVVASKVHRVEGTLVAVRMEISDDDTFFYMDKHLPRIVGGCIAPIVDDFLQSLDLSRSDVDHWIVHPGGRAILEQIETALSISREQLGVSYSALASHGNVGTASVFYVLRQVLDDRNPEPGQLGLVLTLGPGITVGLMLITF